MSKTRTFKWSKLVLVASLALNLVFIGVVAGAWMKGPSWAGREGPHPSFVSGPFGRALSKEDRAAMGEAFRKSPDARKRLGQGRREMRQVSLEIAEVLRAEPFDQTALEALFARQADTVAALTRTGQQTLLARIKAMTTEERAGFADRLEKGMKRGRKNRKP